jgi:hypothetical protein
MPKIQVILKNRLRPHSRIMVSGRRTNTYYGRYCDGEVLEIDERDFNTRRFKKPDAVPKKAAKKALKSKVAPVPKPVQSETIGDGEK